MNLSDAGCQLLRDAKTEVVYTRKAQSCILGWQVPINTVEILIHLLQHVHVGA